MAITSVRQAGLTGFTKYRSLADASGNPVFNIPGMVLLTPTSITHSGTSASIGANGQVTFTAVTSLSLNGVFSADFDNYVVSVRGVVASGGESLRFRLRASGSDASGGDYVFQEIIAGGATVSASRSSSQTSGNIGVFYDPQRNGINVQMYGPFLAQPTAFRGVHVGSSSDAILIDRANTHSLSTAYDGFTLFVGSSNITGALQVYGIRS